MCENCALDGRCQLCSEPAVFLVLGGGVRPTRYGACRPHVDRIRASLIVATHINPTVIDYPTSTGATR